MTKEEQLEELNRSFTHNALSAASADMVDRYGNAVKVHSVAYSGTDNATGQTCRRSLEGVANSRVDPNNPDTSINQQAGFSAEIKTAAREEAERAIRGDNSGHTTRTDDMTSQSDGHGHSIGGTNDQLYDLADTTSDGFYVDGTGRQLKYVGEDPESCCQKLMSKKMDKYREADVPIEVPSDFYDGVQEELAKQAEKVEQQLRKAEERGDTEQVKKLREKQERINKTSKNLRKGSLTKKEAIFARKHPMLSTAQDIARVSHRAGIEGAKAGIAVGGTISLVQNTVAVIKGDQDLDEAAAAILEDTGHAAARGYTTAAAGSVVGGLMKNSKNPNLRAIGNSAFPGYLVNATLDAASVIKQYIDGDIDGLECLEGLGEKGTATISSAIFGFMGSTALPQEVTLILGVKVGIGALLGSMVGYSLACASYGTLVSSLRSARLAAERRQLVEAECAAQIELIRKYRAEMEQMIGTYLSSCTETFHLAFSGIKNALELGDIDGFIDSANLITESLGKQALFHDMDEFDRLMSSDTVIQL